MGSHELAWIGDLWGINQGYGLSATYTLQLNMNKLNSLRSLNSRMYMKLIDLDVLLLYEKWASTVISILKVVRNKYNTRSSTFKSRLMMGVCSYVSASDRDLFFHKYDVPVAPNSWTGMECQQLECSRFMFLRGQTTLLENRACKHLHLP